MAHPTVPRFTRSYLDRENDLAAWIDLVGEPDAIGLDVEMIQKLERLPGGVTRGKQILSLIQMAAGRSSAIIDPLALEDLSPLGPLLSAQTAKIVLGGATDIDLLESKGLLVRNVVDLAEVAVAEFGHGQEGMKALASRTLGVDIDKAIRREDWSQRPLPKLMLAYAYQDAELTLLMYRWFQEHYPRSLNAHQRERFSPVIGASVPAWLQRYIRKPVDPTRLLAEYGLKPDADVDAIESSVRELLSGQLSPGQIRRALRLVGELRLKGLYDDLVAAAHSPSSFIRVAAARSLGKLKVPTAEAVLRGLVSDPVTDVRNVAELALVELTTPEPRGNIGEDEFGSDEVPGPMAPLARLKLDLPPDDLLAKTAWNEEKDSAS
jgi:hypothetical protein